MIKWTTVVCMVAASVTALIAIIMPAVANATAPRKSDTIQTWTCRWKGAVGAPENFGPLCRESVCCYLFPVFAPPPKARVLLVVLADAIPSNSPPTLPSHCLLFIFYSWCKVSRMPLLYLKPSHHVMKSWSSLPKVSTLLLQTRMRVHESSKSITDQGYWF
jgi:hypothetical protein